MQIVPCLHVLGREGDKRVAREHIKNAPVTHDFFLKLLHILFY